MKLYYLFKINLFKIKVLSNVFYFSNVFQSYLIVKQSKDSKRPIKIKANSAVEVKRLEFSLSSVFSQGCTQTPCRLCCVAGI